MKAILCTRFGGPDDLELRDLPDPVPGAGEVVVAVKAAALNFFDTLIIAGKYQYKPPFPFSPAAEFAGVVQTVGEGVADFRVGDRVFLRRAGDVIPEIVRVIVESRPADSRPWEMPRQCPACGAESCSACRGDS